MILETARLMLRELTHSDADDLALIISDSETMRFYPRPFERHEVQEWIQRNLTRYKRDGHGIWAVILKAEQKFIGNCGLVIQEVEGAIEIEVGYQFNKNYWGRGLATEAARSCMYHAFTNLNYPRLISMIRPENVPSQRLALRNGLQIEKEVAWRGYQHYLYAIGRERWAEIFADQT